ncbi:hypothetical protein [Ornithinibacillus californiensis]|uniref:hypothetical protein n=1 Tax=Ornithinibacillus californiensis TaxID=161536 RepID=UPI001F3A2402|nr:hypothetical protein [Ornithinibacillus californiensis]
MFRLKCPYCGEKQYESTASRKRTSMIGFIPFVSLPVTWFVDMSFWVFLIFYFIVYSIIFSFIPSLLKLSNEQEPLW